MQVINTTNLTSKGQVTIPKRIRDAVGLKPGSPVFFDVNSVGEIVLKAAATPAVRRESRPDRFDRAVGILKTNMSTDELMALLRPAD